MSDKLSNLIEQISKATITADIMEFNYSTDAIKCPNCGKDTITFSNYDGGEIYCNSCSTHLNALHFMARQKFNRPLSTFKDVELTGLLKTTCAKFGINHDFLKPEEQVQPARVGETPNTETQKLFGENATEFFKNKFPAFIADNQKFQNRKTGFCNLDAFRNFQSGIYVLGGLPALGKTTFALQLLNQLAKQGETCIFCSFEMSAGFLYSKLLAQEINLLEREGIDEFGIFGKTPEKFIKTSDIIFGNFQYHEESYQQVMKNFEENPLSLYIWEISKIDLNKILNRISRICKTLSKPPVVVIDYLQLLTGTADNQKSALDDTLHKLFNFRRETDTTFIIISSLNRMNYNTEISFESFCGSGGIEYSADCIWGLQLKLDERTHAAAEKAKNEIPREIELKCLKNRFGANFGVGFWYYPNMEIFRPNIEYGEIVSTSKTSKKNKIEEAK